MFCLVSRGSVSRPERSVVGSREDGMRIPLAILFNLTTGLRLIGGNDLATWQLGREVHPHLAACGFHSVNELEGADLRPGPLIVLAGDGTRVGAEVIIADPASDRLVKSDKPLGLLASRGIIAARGSDIARTAGSGIGRHASRRLRAVRPDHAGIGDGNGDLASGNLHLAGRRRVGRAGGEGDEGTKDIKEGALPVTTVLRAHDEPPSPQMWG